MAVSSGSVAELRSRAAAGPPSSTCCCAARLLCRAFGQGKLRPPGEDVAASAQLPRFVLHALLKAAQVGG